MQYLFAGFGSVMKRALGPEGTAVGVEGDIRKVRVMHDATFTNMEAGGERHWHEGQSAILQRAGNEGRSI